MMIKRVCAMLLALVMCTGVFSTTAFAYSNETVSAADVSEATEPEETESVEKQTEDGEDELLDLCQDFGHKKLNFSLLT